jgi:glucoamylase
VGVGPATTERWEEQFGQSPSSIAAIIAGLVAATDTARQNTDPASAARWESTANSWRSSLANRTYTINGYWGDHRYFERTDPTQDPNGAQTIHFDEDDFLGHGVADYGFLDLVRLGVAPDDPNVSTSLSPSASASDGKSTVQVTMPNGDIDFHRYNHDNYGREQQRLHRMAACSWTQLLRAVLACSFWGTRGVRDREWPLG